MSNLNPISDMLWYDPSTKTIQLYDGDSWQSIAPISRIDLTNATSDYMLHVGEEAIINFNNATNVPLNIATQNGTLYEIILSDTTQPTYLYPNNTSYSNQFVTTRLMTYWNGSNYVISSDGNTTSGFMFFGKLNSLIIKNSNNNKKIIAHYDDSSSKHIGISASYWSDTTTVWSSLGTFNFAWGVSGYILVRRLA